MGNDTCRCIMEKIYYADFETTKMDKDGRVRVYLWAIVSGEFEKYGYSLNSFMDYLHTIKGIIFFHNLKFDFSYIFPYLIKNNISYKLLEKNDVIYSVKFFNVDLRDSLNFLPMELKKVGEDYCNVYKKTSIDYNVDYNHRATRVEVSYCINDCRVVEEGLGVYISSLENVLRTAGATESAGKVWKKLTNAGIAFEAFKELSDFEEGCPKTTKQEYDLIREAYRGGYVYSRPNGIMTDIQMIDCNSMYPYMYSTIDMPYGRAYECESEDDCLKYKFFIIGIKAKYNLKPGYIPIIGGGFGRFGSILYKSSSGFEEEVLVLAKQDFELIKKFYDIEYSFLWGVGYNTQEKFFKRYADTFIVVKNREKGVRREVAKVLLNSPYGKLAENGFEEILNYFLDEEGKVSKEVVGYKLEEDRFNYLPMAIAITASARYYLLTTAEGIGFDNVYYMDTDSIKYRNVPVPFKFDSNTLGAWKDEGRPQLFKTVAPKKYGYYDGEKIHFKCAGFNRKTLQAELKDGEKVSYDEAKQLLTMFDKGLALNCLQSHLAIGGRALIPVKKEIK